MKRLRFISQLSCIGVSTFGLRDLDFISPYIADYSKGNVRFSTANNEPVMLSVKVIKEKEQFCTSPTRIEFSSDEWYFNPRLDHNGNFYGENIREVYFNIQSDATDFSPAKLKIFIPGVNAARVIVGYTDVPFEQVGDAVQFELIDDRSRGQLMQLMYQSPWGGYPVAFIHNWKIRKAGEYASEDFPAAEFASVHNYLLAAQEVLRQMGNMGPGLSKPFKGEIVLMGSEAAATRGHMDYPPHVHIMHYEFGNGINSEKEWKSRLVPHFYMDKLGNINRNKYEVIVGKGERTKEFGPGEAVQFEDSVGRRIMDLIIDKGGIVFRHPDGQEYSIRPDPRAGAQYAVYGYHNNETTCRARVKDYPDIGVFRIRLEKLNKGKIVKVLNDGYIYDPFTAHKFKELYPPSSF